MPYKLNTRNHNGNKLILYFSTKVHFDNAKTVLENAVGKNIGNRAWTIVPLADYVIEVNDNYSPVTERLLKCRYAGGLEAIMDEFIDGKDDR